VPPGVGVTWPNHIAPYSAGVDFEAGVAQLVSGQGWALAEKDEPMTYAHLACMVSGYGLDEAPGLAWEYNSYGARLHAETLKRVFAGSESPDSDALDVAAQTRLVQALGMEDGGIFTVRNDCGVDITPRDMARIGHMWLARGAWDGEQLLADAWFDVFLSPGVAADLARSTGQDAGDYLVVGTTGGPLIESSVDNMQGIFGWMLWFNGLVAETGVRMWPDAPTDMYMADGRFGDEVMIVLPTEEIVVAAHGSWGDTTVVSDGAGVFNNNIETLAGAVTGAPSYAMDFPGVSWTSATDAEAGLDETALDAFVDAIDNAAGSRGVLVRRGRVVRTWGTQTTKVDWASAAKSVVVTMLGFAIQEGLI
jgi:CubicO group peptidase (beta-lactamase class C family)